MKIFHYNDEERDLHRWLAERGHTNTVVNATGIPPQSCGASRSTPPSSASIRTVCD